VVKNEERWSGLRTQLNQWGSAREPFLLLADFELQQLRAIRLSDIDSSVLRFQFHQHSNYLIPPLNTVPPLEWSPTYVSAQRYQKAFQRVQEGLQRGDSFLTNLTFPTSITTNWSLEEIYHQTQARYKLWWKDHFTVFSPEIFVQIKDQRIFSYPMKGTLPAYLNGEQLLADPKESAEHATIVDLIRNDLSQVASQVRVEDYRYLERLSTPGGGLWQTSTRIGGTLVPDFHHQLGDILLRLLPAGSISGAPKIETVNIIQEAEGQPRGFYTGIAALWDGYELDSCVLIRFVEKQEKGMRYWSGGGITAYSNWEEEYQELKEKVYLPLRAAEKVDLSLS
jgi:para-aminobenzoate synthetase component 1